jgi:hypothetical protein
MTIEYVVNGRIEPSYFVRLDNGETFEVEANEEIAQIFWEYFIEVNAVVEVS